MRDSRRISILAVWILAAASAGPVFAHDSLIEDHVATTYGYGLLRGPAPAYEVCAEDHVAATYDHAVVAKAEAKGQHVLFVAVRGKDAGAPSGEAAIRRALAKVGAVDRASIRYSAFPSAASFSWDPRRASPAELLRSLNGGLGGSGLTVVALKVIS